MLFQALIERRLAAEPIAYILGTQEFMGFEFFVNSHVLIPRPDSEILVEEVIKWLECSKLKKVKLLDIGTGSGCLSLSLLKLKENICAEAWDISKEALEVAKVNRKKLNVATARMLLQAKDVLADKSWDNIYNRFDVIISNPPYIAYTEEQTLARSVLDYEPRQALFAESEGLIFYQTMALQAHKVLKNDGVIFFEVSPHLCAKIIAILKKFHWTNIKVSLDLSGRQRVVQATNTKYLQKGQKICTKLKK